MTAVSPLAWHVIAEVVQRMQNDLDRDWSLEQAAAAAGYEVHHFAHVFRDAVGLPPLRYVRQLRLERSAHELLANPSQPIGEIGARAGYASVEAYGRAFRRAFAISPRAFRREARLRAGERESDPPPRPDGGRVDFPPHLHPDPIIERVGPVHAWAVRVPSFELDEVGAAVALLMSRLPPDGPWQLGGISQPWGWETTMGTELSVFRRIEPPAPPPEPPVTLSRTPRGWYARFDYEGPIDQVADICTWIIRTWVPRAGLRQAFAPLFTLLETPMLDPTAAHLRIHAPIEPLTHAAE